MIFLRTRARLALPNGLALLGVTAVLAFAWQIAYDEPPCRYACCSASPSCWPAWAC